MIALLALGTVWFWILLSVAVICILIAVENDDRWGWATTTVIAFFLLLFFLGSKPWMIETFNYIAQHPGVIVAIVIGYLGMGILWSFFKWFVLLRGIKREVDTENASRLKNKFTSFVSYSSYVPRGANRRNKITTWMIYWPFSALWVVINDPFRRTFQYIYDSLAGVYSRIEARILREPESTEITKA